LTRALLPETRPDLSEFVYQINHLIVNYYLLMRAILILMERLCASRKDEKHEALDALDAEDHLAAEVVKLRYFAVCHHGLLQPLRIALGAHIRGP
jgi:hypothetical protein